MMQFFIRSMVVLCVIPFSAIVAMAAVMGVLLPSLGVGSYEHNKSIYIAAFFLVVLSTIGAFRFYIRSWKKPDVSQTSGFSSSMRSGFVWGLAALVGVLLFYLGLQSSHENMELRWQPEHAAFQAANNLLAGTSQGLAHGNSPTAQTLAESLSSRLKEASSKGIERRGSAPVISLTKGNFLTYCLLTQERCVFLVHVPGLRNYSSEAKEFITEAAWAAAMDITSPYRSDLRILAIGTRGLLQYDRVISAALNAEGKPAALTPGYVKGDRECRAYLQGFFAPHPPSSSVSSDEKSTRTETR